VCLIERILRRLKTDTDYQLLRPESADNATKDDKVSALQAQKAEIARRCVGCGFFTKLENTHGPCVPD
jgi:hypothetical protein